MDFLAGQAVGLVQEIKPAGEIIREVAAQAEDILAGRLPTITGRNIFESRKRRKGA
jgi:NAD(P)H-dependent flavin oxidoreductase YrpB (nitropropane dioxygenase family)